MFRKGQKVMSIHQRSPWNTDKALFYRIEEDFAEPAEAHLVLQ
jgi:hypothetical protein